jgi:hypothetical protein
MPPDAHISRAKDVVDDTAENLDATLLYAPDENRNDIRYNWFRGRFWRVVAPVHCGANEGRGD